MIGQLIHTIRLVAFSAMMVVVYSNTVAVQADESETNITNARMTVVWKNLSSTNYLKADDAFQRFVAAGSSAVPFLTKRIRHVAIPKVDVKRLHHLASQLGSKQFQVRQKATAELAKYGELSVVPLQKILESKPPLEIQRRATNLLKAARVPVFTADRIRAMEGIQILEAMATREANQALAEIARDALIPMIRFQAKQATKRIARNFQQP